MRCFTASVTVCFNVCSRSKMRRRDFWRELADATTPHQFFDHWLPVKQRVDYKLATFVYKSLRGQAPSYLVDDCQLIADSGRPQLPSAHANVLTVLRTNTRLGDRSFSVADPRIWNSLLAWLRQPDIDFGHFKRLLKEFLFGETAAH